MEIRILRFSLVQEQTTLNSQKNSLWVPPKKKSMFSVAVMLTQLEHAGLSRVPRWAWSKIRDQQQRHPRLIP